jgi:hypothetical protein
VIKPFYEVVKLFFINIFHDYTLLVITESLIKESRHGEKSRFVKHIRSSLTNEDLDDLETQGSIQNVSRVMCKDTNQYLLAELVALSLRRLRFLFARI